MPLIKSKKYGHEQFVDPDTWRKLQENDRANRYIVIDDEDLKMTVKETPNIFEPIIQPEELGISLIHHEDRDGLKDWLEQNDIEFLPKTSTKKLYELYLKNCSNE